MQMGSPFKWNQNGTLARINHIPESAEDAAVWGIVEEYSEGSPDTLSLERIS